LSRLKRPPHFARGHAIATQAEMIEPLREIVRDEALTV
jgi:hypothetical protein